MPLLGGFGRMSSTGGFPLPTSMRVGDMLDKATARLKASRSKLAKAKKDLTAHKEMMKRSRFTPEGYKKATTKLHALEKHVAALQKQVAKDLMLATSIG